MAHAGANGAGRALRRERGRSLMMLGRGFELNGVKLPGFPCPLGSKGGLLLPAIDYLTERAVYQRIDVKTVRQEAYVLREWFAFCEGRQRSWMEPDDAFLLSWRTDLEMSRVGTRMEDPEAWSRNNLKIGTIVRFYQLMQVFLHAFDSRIVGDPGRDGEAEAALTVVSSSGRTGIRPRTINRVRYGSRPELLIGRPTPRPEQVVEVLASAADRYTELASSTHYLMARCMAQAGLRAIGVSSMTVAAISHALLAEGIGDQRGGKPRALDLSAIAADPKGRAAVRRRVADLVARYRKHLFVKVTEKRKVTRNVAVPLALCTELLEYIWDDRFRFVQRRTAGERTGGIGDEVFLSFKTGAAYTAGAISNILSEAFEMAGIPGSGHRLRAAYAEEVVRDAYLRARAVHGRNYDPEAIRILVREALGHMTDGTLSRYLNRITVEENLMPGQPVLVRQEEHAHSVRALVDELDEGNPVAVRLLDDVLGKLGREPRPEPSTLEDLRSTVGSRRAGKPKT